MNSLFLGDNLEILRKLDSESADLIYLDPPFFSNRNYEVIWGDKGEIRSFQDRWSGGIDHYIAWLKERVAEMHRILKPTGSIFLHCDWHANAYIRVYILDKLFGEQNFRGEIIWKRANAHNDAKKKLAVLTDTIWYYSKSEKCTYNPIYVPLSEEYASDAYRYEDGKGKYRLVVLTGPKINLKDEEWKGYHPKNIGRSWSVPKFLVNALIGEADVKKLSTNQKLDLLYDNGYIEFSQNGTPNYKRYLEEGAGVIVSNVWIDIKNLQGIARELLGYPTQKPEALLERIILCASNEGDVVLDPFVGGGTTVAVADRLNRAWVGIDQSVQAVKVTEMRLQKQQNLFSKPFITVLHKYDYDTLRYKDAFQFEEWIVTRRGGIPNTKQRGDMGIDGKHRSGTPIQVKRSDNVGRNVVDNFVSAAKRFDSALFEKNKQENNSVGEIIAFSFNKGAVQEVARLKNEEGIIIELIKVEDIVPIAKKPLIQVSFTDLGLDAKGNREIEFQASGESEAGIEFYAWQWNYDVQEGFKPDILIDKEGLQRRKFSAGTYHLAVKVVDNDGLEALEVIKLKVNGGVSKS